LENASHRLDTGWGFNIFLLHSMQDIPKGLLTWGAQRRRPLRPTARRNSQAASHCRLSPDFFLGGRAIGDEFSLGFNARAQLQMQSQSSAGGRGPRALVQDNVARKH
jgi:hypothetical protein